MRVEESLNVKFDESPPPKSPPLVDDDILENDIIENQDKDLEIKENDPLNKEIKNIKNSKDHPIETALAISTTEAEYVSAGKACQQALWMKQALVDYDIKLDDIPVLCDNKGAMDLRNITIEKVASEDNIADILTKPLKREPFNLLRLGLGLMEPNA
ncbi:hypothetical protein Tco_1384711 [Tanacetum coccineum]